MRFKTDLLRLLMAASLSLSLVGCDEVFDLIFVDPGEPVIESDVVPAGGEDSLLVPTVAPSVAATSAPVLGVGEGIIRVEAPTGETVVDDLKDVSGVFDVRFDSENREDVILNFPVDKSLLPEDVAGPDFELQRQDPDTGEWLSEGFLMGWDPAQQVVRFMVSNPIQPGFEVSVFKLYKYRMLLHTFDLGVTVQKSGSPFRITYFPPTTGYESRVRSDSGWSGSGNYSEPAIPNYIEDLDTALQEAYQGLLKLKNSAGQAVFSKLETPIPITVTDTGKGVLGNSPLGGPAKISANGIQNYQDMRLTAAHELVHVFQGQYYFAAGLFSGHFNRWFIESSAQYFTAEALGLTREERGQFYSDNNTGLESYMSVPMHSNNGNTYYALGHFLDWLAQETHRPVAQNVLSADQFEDLAALRNELQQSPFFESLEQALFEYHEALMTYPETEDGFGNKLKQAMRAYTSNQKFLDKNVYNLTPSNIYMSFERDFPPFSASYLNFQATTFEEDGLLVLKPKAQVEELKSRIYPKIGKSSNDYLTLEPLDFGTSLFAQERLTLEHFGRLSPHNQVEIWLTNTSEWRLVPGAFEMYILPPPRVTAVEDGKVTWAHETGDIPRSVLDGYNIYLGDKLLESDKRLQFGDPHKTYENPAITGGSPVVVTILDKQGNEWPKAPEFAGGFTPNPLTKSEADLFTEHSYNQKMKGGEKARFHFMVPGAESHDVNWELVRLMYDDTISRDDYSHIGYLEPQSDQSVIFHAKETSIPQTIWVLGTSKSAPSAQMLVTVFILLSD